METYRVFAMPNSKTFSVAPIKAFVQKYTAGAEVIVDPFANDCKFGTITNDLNTEFDTNFHMDALDFLKMLPDGSADVVLYDPPYSPRQVSECYKKFGLAVTQETTQSSWRRKHLDEICRITKVGGVVLSFGWNSNGVGISRGFEQLEVLLVAHGGAHNDTICTAEKKIKNINEDLNYRLF